MIAKNGFYSFNVSPGDYKIVAKWENLVTEEKVSVKGSVRFDLILFPEIALEPEPVIEEPKFDEPPYYLLSIAISGAVVLFLVYLKRRDRREDLNVLPEDLAKVVEIIRKEGGRITQKDLRKKLGYSEAKMSLVIADLERRGIIEKIKKGRGNIIFLKGK